MRLLLLLLLQCRLRLLKRQIDLQVICPLLHPQAATLVSTPTVIVSAMSTNNNNAAAGGPTQRSAVTAAAVAAGLLALLAREKRSMVTGEY